MRNIGLLCCVSTKNIFKENNQREKYVWGNNKAFF